MTEQPHDPRDPGDHSGSIDGEMVVALTEIDAIIEKHIRGAVGDDAYEAYNARVKLDQELNQSMGQEVKEGFVRPIDRIMGQAVRLIKQMVDEGMDEQEARKKVSDAAVEAIIAQHESPADKNYLEAYGDITDSLRLSIEDSLKLTQKYLDIEVASVDEGQLSLELMQRIEIKGSSTRKVTLNVIFSIDESSISMSAFHTILIRDLLEGSHGGIERTEVDLVANGNVIDGVDLVALKQDAFQALQTAVRSAS
ncbi:MAG: hypothetical protein M0R47_21680 [Methylobacter sp.]|uniref:hypothetical protein n=1 Tax=Methylobacter sp. TaxID=2051955 RepID=UPI0025F803FB|nr:hypothetical protein [Methylobacter sp.]MCK9623132.1 hypothetical protein [Methylobacter sp.]